MVFNNGSTTKNVSDRPLLLILKQIRNSRQMRKETEAKNVSTAIATNLEAQNKDVLQEKHFNISLPNSNILIVLHNYLQFSKLIQMLSIC